MILVTGGTGLVGTHLLYELTRSGEKVRVLNRAGSNVRNLEKVFSYYTPDAASLLKNIEWFDADLLDVYSLLDAMEGVTEVYHCAAMVTFEQRYKEQMMKINVEGTANLVNAALEKKVQKFCHVSSIAALGRAEHGGLTSEQTLWKSSPENSNYAISKYGAEREVWRGAEEGLNVVIVNPALIIGGGNWVQSSSNMFSKGYKGLRYFSSGGSGFVDVRDVVAIMVRLMKSGIRNERFLLVSENTSYRQYFDVMHEAFGKRKPSIKAGKFLSGVAWRADKLRSALTGSAPLITKETAASANRTHRFSNEKILKTFPDFRFISMEQSVKDTCRLFLKDLGK
jgi:nucleoside-diphosphate-sugar epimerase